MKWVQWNINGISNSTHTLKSRCEDRFKYLNIVNANYFKDERCSFASIETCKYKYDVPNASNDAVSVFGDIELFNLPDLCTKYALQHDTHSLIHLYEKCGEKIFKELNGEYTFVLYDKKRNVAFLVVDSLGAKELFWDFSNGILTASTDMFLMNDIISKREWNNQYFKDFLQLNGIYTGNESPYQSIFRILPGHYVSINFNNSKVREVKYWDLCEIRLKTRYKTESEYFEQFRLLLAQALERRLLPQKNGIAMSGGLDSTALFAISKSALQANNIKPVSGIFSELQDCDESYFIQKVCELYETSPLLVNCDNCGMLTNFPDQYPVSSEPHCPSLSSSFTLKILECAFHGGVTNLLDGCGADHLLSGTPLTSVDLLKRGKILYLLKYIRDISYMYDESVFMSIKKNLIERTNEDVDSVLLKHIENSLRRIETHNQKHIYAQVFYAKTFKLLDRNMAPNFNISVRHPFLDRDLVEYVYSIPGEMLIQKRRDKFLIREGMKQYLPPEIIKKTQKTQHVSLSFRGINKVWNNVYATVAQYRQGQLFDSNISKVEWLEMLQGFRSGKEFNNTIFSMLCLELWLAQNFGKA